ncbi:MAG: hypothetical protein E7095_03685 [Bacteroides sp.]|nr:hypothetical protein [Bacteroides sp.]
MNKKFLSAILFGALMVTSTGTFVSCKDYDDDIDSLQGQVDTNVSAIDALKSQLSSLQTAGSAAQATADAAKAAADAAKKAGDDAKAAAEEAKAAAAQAKADAIAEAANQVAALKAIVEANKLSQDQLQTLIATVSGKVEAIDADINELKGLVTTEDGKTLADIAAVVADLEEQVAALQAGGVASEEITGLIESLQGQLNTVTGNVWTLIEDVDAIMTAIAGNQENVDAAIADLNQRLANSYGELDELWAEINGEGANSIRTQMGQLANLINELQTQYNTLSVLVAPQLGSLTFIPYEIIDGVEGLTYGSFSYKALTLKDKDNKDGKEKADSATTATVVNPTVYAYYHVSPKGIAIDSIKNKLAFTLVKDASYTETRAASSKDFAMTPEFDSYDAATGVLKVKVNVTGTAATAEKMTLFALQADQVTSDYALIHKSDMDDIEIADEKLAKDIDNHYRRAIKGINGVDDEAYIADVTAWESPEDVEVDTTLVYNDTKGLDLNTIVTAHAVGSECTVADIEKYGFAWKFEVVKNYGIGTPATPQEEFVTLSEAGVLTARVYETEGRAAIGRTPIIRVSLIDTNNNNAIVKCAYIKVRIIDSAAAPQEPVAVTMEVDPFEFDCAEDANGVTVKEINLKIYNELGLSYEQFLEAYPVFEDWGALQTPAHIGTVTPSDNSENPGEGTDVITWTITEQELWDNAGKEVTHIIRYYNDTKTNYVAFQLKSTIGGIHKKYNIAKADFISNYWNEAKEWTKFNVAVPSSTTDEDPANCTFINNLNAPFTTWAANSTEGVPGILKLDKNVKDIEFYFCKEVADIKKIGDINVIFSISEDGLTLYGKKKAADTPQIIATINNEDATWGNVVTYNKESDLAKELLNAGPAAMYTYIGAKGYVCGQNAKEVTITFDGKDHFQANFIRPVNIAEKAADNFIDGVDVGEKGSFIRLEDLIDPYDWRDRYFKDYKNYWGYYGEFKVEVDTENAECNLNGVTQAVPVTVVLEQSDATSMGDGADKKESKYGFLTYKNNGTKVSEFEIYVKVKVTYGWGVIETKPITVKVASTITKE